MPTDDDVLINYFASSTRPGDTVVVAQTPKDVEGDGMQIDEEGRPKFKPAGASVRTFHITNDDFQTTNECPSPPPPLTENISKRRKP